MEMKEIGWDHVEGLHQGQDRDEWSGHVNTAMNLR